MRGVVFTISDLLYGCIPAKRWMTASLVCFWGSESLKKSFSGWATVFASPDPVPQP